MGNSNSTSDKQYIDEINEIDEDSLDLSKIDTFQIKAIKEIDRLRSPAKPWGLATTLGTIYLTPAFFLKKLGVRFWHKDSAAFISTQHDFVLFLQLALENLQDNWKGSQKRNTPATDADCLKYRSFQLSSLLNLKKTRYLRRFVNLGSTKHRKYQCFFTRWCSKARYLRCFLKKHGIYDVFA